MLFMKALNVLRLSEMLTYRTVQSVPAVINYIFCLDSGATVQCELL